MHDCSFASQQAANASFSMILSDFTITHMLESNNDNRNSIVLAIVKLEGSTANVIALKFKVE